MLFRMPSVLTKKHLQLQVLFPGAGSGIRTHAPLRANGFQDRLVMTASISLHILFCRRALPDRLIIPHTGGDCQVYVKKRAGLSPFFLKKVLHLCLFYGNITVLSVILSAYMRVTALYGGDQKRASIRRFFTAGELRPACRAVMPTGASTRTGKGLVLFCDRAVA